MKKLYCLTLALALSASAFVQAPTVASFAQDHGDNVVRWNTIVGNITVS